MKRRFACYFWFVSWTDVSLGINVDFGAPCINIHLPFGFVRIGMRDVETDSFSAGLRDKHLWRAFGFGYK